MVCVAPGPLPPPPVYYSERCSNCELDFTSPVRILLDTTLIGLSTRWGLSIAIWAIAGCLSASSAAAKARPIIRHTGPRIVHFEGVDHDFHIAVRVYGVLERCLRHFECDLHLSPRRGHIADPVDAALARLPAEAAGVRKCDEECVGMCLPVFFRNSPRITISELNCDSADVRMADGFDDVSRVLQSDGGMYKLGNMDGGKTADAREGGWYRMSIG